MTTTEQKVLAAKFATIKRKLLIAKHLSKEVRKQYARRIAALEEVYSEPCSPTEFEDEDEYYSYFDQVFEQIRSLQSRMMQGSRKKRIHV